MGKQTCKLKLPKGWRIYDVFHISLLKHDIIKEGRVDKAKPRLEFDNSKSEGDGGSKKYKVEAIWNSAVYTKETEDYLPGLYYLVS